MTRRSLLVGVYMASMLLAQTWAEEQPAVIEAANAPDTSPSPATAAPAPLDVIWNMGTGEITPSAKVQLSVSAPEETPADQPITFECHIQSQGNFDKAHSSMIITDRQGTIVTQGTMEIRLLRGENKCAFEWPAAAAANGDYSAAFELNYTDEDDPVRCTLHLKRVTSQQLTGDLSALRDTLASLHKQLDALDNPARLPYIRARVGIGELFAGRAAQKAAEGAWQSVAAINHYLEITTQAAAAAFAFGALTPELADAALQPDLSSLEVHNGAMFAAGRPLFLFGRVLSEATAEAVAQVRALGLNLAVLSLPPRETLANESEIAAFQAQFDPAFDQAAASNVSIVAELSPDTLGEWTFDKWPDIKDHGFVDLTHPGVHETFLRHIHAVAPYLADRKMVSALTLTHNTPFRYDTEEVRQAFLETVRQRYPDRQTLNQVWHAHLANYDEITIWDNEAPEWSYQNRRAYQYEWQNFHRHLIHAYYQELRDAVREKAPRLPLAAVLPDAAFELAETRMTPNRETLAGLLDIGAYSVITEQDDPHYALRFPNSAAFYALSKSFAPEKPVLNIDARFSFTAPMEASAAMAFVYAAVWESVINGAAGLALDAATPIFDQPETAEAFITAALDINRLAPIIHAIQQTPPAIGILFSDAAKIFDDGNPHLKSARYAYEGCSFAGYSLRFITEPQIKDGILDSLKVVVIPQTPAVSEDTFNALMAYTKKGGAVARVGAPIPYDEWGQSRRDVVQNTGNTVLVRGMNLPTEYLHAMDAAIVLGQLPAIPRPINPSGYPIEGVKTRYAEVEGEPYLYLINLRKDPIKCHLAGGMQSGRDLIRGRDVAFPRILDPLDPMLIHLDKVVYRRELEAAASPLKHQ